MSESEQITGAPVLEKKNTSFGGDVFRLVGGTVIAQIIGVITIPIISRFFGPEAYGTAALFTSITSILVVICCWRYELAIVIPKKDEEAASVFFVSLLATSITTSIIFIITAFWAEPIFKLLKTETLLPFKWFIPCFVAAYGVFTTFNYWNSRLKRFNRVALAGVLNSTAFSFINIIAGIFKYTSAGIMICSYTIGRAIASFSIGLEIIKKDWSFLKANYSFKNILTTAKIYKKFPLIDIWSAFLNTLSSNIASILLAFYFNSIIVGYFAFGYRFLSLPLSLIASSMSQVFFQRGAAALHENKLNTITEEVFYNMYMFCLFPIGILAVIGPELFSFVFGEKWYEAGIYAQYLAPWIFFNMVCSPLTTISETTNHQEVGLLFNILLLISRLLALYIGGLSKDIYYTLTIYSFSGAIIYILWICQMLKLSKCRLVDTFKKVFKETLLVGFILIPIIIFKFNFKNDIVLFLLVAIISLIYLWLFLKRNNKLKHKLLSRFRAN
ncbi:MAG: lipopolysaccharide biosynthesis protein [Candidatus Riflebacteria bacterium]|nr:lipopolysaccharide biosynthesis protein [Candidatus Riflebacteria bacterium]